MDIVLAFELLGHDVHLTSDGKIAPRHNGASSDESKRLLAAMKSRKAEVVEYLIKRDFINTASEALQSTGYAKFWSQSLMEMVYIIKDWSTLASLPKGAMVFSYQEIHALALGIYTPAELHDLATEKRTLLATHRAHLESLIKAPANEAPVTPEYAANMFGGRIIEKNERRG